MLQQTTRPVGAAIVAYYGATSDRVLDDHVARLQDAIAARLGPVFVPRPIEHVHCTVIGLDSLGPWSSASDLTDPAGQRSAVVRAAVAHLQQWEGWPLTLQFGGFADRDLEVSSRGARLHERSVTINGLQVVLLGWPVSVSGAPTAALTEVRRDLGPLGVVHRYRLDGPFGDPDAHMVLGELAEPLGDERAEQFFAWVREHLLAHSIQVQLDPAALSIVVYSDTRLPVGTIEVPLAAVSDDGSLS